DQPLDIKRKTGHKMKVSIIKAANRRFLLAAADEAPLQIMTGDLKMSRQLKVQSLMVCQALAVHRHSVGHHLRLAEVLP
ncbi:hypothetical protein HAX54_034817, partial [Datura stramonium]|nr:hypothetical protein [Datura stramonium]